MSGAEARRSLPMTAQKVTMARMRLRRPANDNGPEIADPEEGLFLPALILLCAWGAAASAYVALLGT